VKSYFFLFLLLLVSTVFAQKELSLTDCIKYGYDHNLSINSDEIEVVKSKISLNQSFIEYLPSINTEFNHYFNSSKSLSSESYSWSNNIVQQGNMAISADLIVFQGLYRLYNKKTSFSTYNASKLTLEKYKLLLGLEIIKSYHRLKLLLESIEILETTFKQTNTEIQKLLYQIEAGTLPKSDLYEMKAQAKKESVSIINIRVDLVKEYNNLGDLINWQEPYKLEILPTSLISDSTYSNTEELIDSQIASIVLKSVLVAEKDANIATAMHQIKKQKSVLYPTLSANASLSSSYLIDAINPIPESNKYPINSQIRNGQIQQVGMTLSIPIFNQYRNKTNIKLLELYISELENEKEQASLSLNTELQNIKADIFSLSLRIAETTEMADLYQKSYMVALEKFSAGLLNSYSLNTSKNNFIKSKLEKNKLTIEYEMNSDLLGLYSSSIVE
jgi:outer membrane protein